MQYRHFDQVIFLHIKKTGGTTFTIPMRLVYGYKQSMQVPRPDDSPPDYYLRLSTEEKKAIRAMQGHFFYGIHEHCPGTSAYVTILREPVERAASLYRMMQAEWPETRAPSLSLKEFIQRGDKPLPNEQVRRVAGVASRDIPIDASMLEEAKQNIEEDFLVCGTTERYDETLLLMRRRLGWWMPPFYIRQRSRKKEKRPIPPEVADLIRERNRWDVELYRYVSERLEAEIAREGNHFQSEVKRFHQANRVFSVLGTVPLRIFRTMRDYFKAQNYAWVKRRLS